jgi:hypothetical protein
MRLMIALLGVGLMATVVGGQEPHASPLTIPLDCPSGDCPLLKGVPQNAGMMSGYVRLAPQMSVGWHTRGSRQ